MSRIIRTISLDQRTDELAGKKPNFSAWVRNQLLEDSQNVSLIHVTKAIFEKDGLCNPSGSPRCTICFPYGKPPLELIRKYNNEKGINGIGIDQARENLLRDSKKHYDGVVVDMKPMIEEKSPLAPPRRERKYITRSLKWIWSFI
tara:strand:- start:1909 stop:2343 length:435 start_codon:yes stop_codon:yes gene_type:complete